MNCLIHSKHNSEICSKWIFLFAFVVALVFAEEKKIRIEHLMLTNTQTVCSEHENNDYRYIYIYIYIFYITSQGHAYYVAFANTVFQYSLNMRKKENNKLCAASLARSATLHSMMMMMLMMQIIIIFILQFWMESKKVAHVLCAPMLRYSPEWAMAHIIQRKQPHLYIEKVICCC